MFSKNSLQGGRPNRTIQPNSADLLVAAARKFLANGWPIVPLFGKVPALAWKEFQSRLPEAAEVEQWLVSDGRKPSGLGIVTGRLSGLVVVDCDTCDDATFWQEHFPSSPLMVRTGGGGIHFYYAMPNDIDVRNRSGVLGRKIDVRAEGGYATAPPSLHPNGQRYAWLAHDASPTLPAFSPEWVVDIRTNSAATFGIEGTTVRNAVGYIHRINAVAGQGGHNATFRAACKLRDAGLSEDEAFAVLSDWNATNAKPSWSAAELLHKVNSAFASAPRTKNSSTEQR